MDYLFFDTSALVKRYYEEPGSEIVDSLVESEESTAVITSIAVIEAVSAFRRKQNRDDVSSELVTELVAAFFDEALADFLVLPTQEALFEHSFDLVLEDDLRTLDSLQLSAAIRLDNEVDEARFVCADEDLVSVAEKRGIETIVPDARA